MRAYSLDLRDKIAESVKKGVPKSETAHRFGVHRDWPPFAVPVMMRVWVRILAPSVTLSAQSSVPTKLQWPQIPPGSSTLTLRAAGDGCSARGSHRPGPALP